MTFDELSEDQKIQVKHSILKNRNETRGEGTSYEELALAGDLVSDEDAREWSKVIDFVPEDLEYSKKDPRRGDNYMSVMENVARISADNMGNLVDMLSEEMDSRDIIYTYIIPWAEEAERLYQETKSEMDAKGDYLDWLDEFVAKKMTDLRIKRQKSKKKGIETTTVHDVPAWSVLYFVYGYKDNLDEEYQELVIEYEKKLLEQGLKLIAPIKGTENSFNSHPAFGLAFDTVDFDAEVIELKDKEA